MNREQKKIFDDEVKILRKLSIPGNKYTAIAYASKTFEEINKEDNKKKIDAKTDEKAYYVMDYFSRGLLFSYIISGKLTQRQAKLIFKKLIESFKFLHNKFSILHFDIKPDNIMLDKDFTPIIIDFTFSKQYRDKDGNITPVTTRGGSDQYRAPEIYEGKELMDEKADVFSLGVVLFNLITSRKCFNSSKETDNLYRLIRQGNDNSYKSYWDRFKSLNLSKDFKDLYQKMVAYEPNKRPTFDEILNHPFLKDMKELTPKEEDQIKNELENLFIDYIIYTSEERYEENEKTIKNEHLETKAGESKGDKIFENKDLEPKKISEDRILLNQAIIIIINISEVDFMNSLCNEIDHKFKNHCYLRESKDSLKIQAIFS